MRLFALLLLWLCGPLLFAQNLVRNPSFEELTRCPKKMGELSVATGWSSPNGATPDVYSTCFVSANAGPGVPANLHGNQPPMHGNCYAGIGQAPDNHEWLQGEFTQPLVKGTRYVLRFRIARKPYSRSRLPEIDVAFTHGLRSNKDPLFQDPSLTLNRAIRSDSAVGSGWDNWFLYFEAQGGEDHFLVGQAPTTYRDGVYVGDHYFFFDYFELFPCLDGADCTADYYLGEADPDPGNLVPNGGFEQYFECPGQREDLSAARAWRVAAYTPDFYQVCGSGTASIPVNEMGTQWPHGGEAYGGFWAYVIPGLDYREFLSIQLKEPLRRGQRYQLTLWLSLAEVSNYALCGLTVRAGTTIPENPRVAPEPGEFSVEMEADGALQDRNGWQPLRAIFLAQGGERYLTIGNYRQAADGCLIEIGGNTLKYKAAQKAAYYYVDDVRLSALPMPPPEPPVTAEPLRWHSGDTLRLRNVIFAFDQAQIQAAAFPQLDSLAGFLAANPGFQIDITGHTDSEGEEAYNWRLSQRRAESLRAYLLAKGLPATQVSAGGLGESRPIASNASPQGREQNRRVEIVFFKPE